MEGIWHRRKTASVILHVLFSTYMSVSGAQIHDPALTESAGNSGTIQSREIWEGCSSSVCEYCNSSIVTCLLKSFHFLCNESLKYNNRQFPTRRSPSQHDKYVRKERDLCRPPCVFHHQCTGIPKQAMTYWTMCNCW